jgi:hypothetical protein
VRGYYVGNVRDWWVPQFLMWVLCGWSKGLICKAIACAMRTRKLAHAHR